MRWSGDKKVHGVGINDSTTPVKTAGKRDPTYLRWAGMLRRCYSKEYLEKNPTYREVRVCEAWLTFSNFREWLDKREAGDSLQLDKDFLGDGKMYSPETCCLVPGNVNNVLRKKQGSMVGIYPYGVTKVRSLFRGQISRRGKALVLGHFKTPEMAHTAWQEARAENILMVLEEYKKEPCYDRRVGSRLLECVENLREDIRLGRETKRPV